MPAKPNGKKQPERKEDESSDATVNSDDDDDTSSSDASSCASSDNKGTNQPGFTDDNAKWLKPKKTKADLLASSSEDEGSEEEDDDDLLEIEQEAKLVDREMEEERVEAEQELQRTIREHTEVYHLPTDEEILKDADRVVPPSELRGHIESILEVLSTFKERREPGRSRTEYMERLKGFIAELYGYLPELVEYFLTMFSPAEALEFVNASDQPRPLVIRTNTLKTRRKDLAAALIKRGVSLDPLANWSKVGLKIVESPVPIGATPEYLSGHYMLQSAASMCPVLALGPESKERILDMSSAPGGKTSYIAQLMRNTGVLIANDLKPERQKATVANLHRLGVKNTITMAQDGRKLGAAFRNRFDRILLDAPCSGLGVISRDPSVKVQRTMADVKHCAHLQKELLLAAIDCLKYKNTSGGVMVYSTCSVSVFENEEVVQYALEKRDIKLVDTGLSFGAPGFLRYQHKRFHPSMEHCRRFYPHTVNLDGFFVCKIQKLSDKRSGFEKKGAAEELDPKATKEANKGKEAKTTDTPKGKKSTVGGNKRKLDEKKDKPSKVSVPPKNKGPSKKKTKTNAKVTKPRRQKHLDG